jgi:hypothetical protein
LPKKGPSEHETQGQILDWLKHRHIFHYRQNTGGAKFKGYYVKFGIPGAPDIVAVVRGRFIGIEVKKAGEELSNKQADFKLALEAAGGCYIRAYSVKDVEEAFALS